MAIERADLTQYLLRKYHGPIKYESGSVETFDQWLARCQHYERMDKLAQDQKTRIKGPINTP